MKLIKAEFDTFISSLKEMVKSDEDKLIERISINLESEFINILSSLEECESPIEKIFSLELNHYLGKSKLYLLNDVVEIDYQREIKLFPDTQSEKKYRLDFFIRIYDMNSHTEYGFAIECDGHEFHEKTKEQVIRDKNRDRDLLEAGIISIRFSGSEIYDNPAKAARDTIRIIEKFIFNIYK